ncbi:MAG TPA: LytTR family DNA-binding domain-containing protein [Mucilaginibacter sp.]|jgi:DNA-binding LytR/AlgR family response regulator|nr:LytTR family DNA-binding domain-containing protein [Mucilaginibacter sp.]
MNTCYIIDDEEHAIDTLVGYVDRYPGLSLVGTNINPVKAVDHIINSGAGIDIVFLDVDMPELSGLDVADIISSHSSIIFTTAFPNYAVQAFEKNGSDFLLKPISFERFTKSVTKVQNLIKSQKAAEHPGEEEHFFINPGTKGKVVQLRYSDILYIEGLKNYVMIYTADNKYITYLSIQEIEKSIPPSRFPRIHKSFIVNIDKIKYVDSNEVFIGQNLQLPIGRLFKDNFFDLVHAKTLKSGRKR